MKKISVFLRSLMILMAVAVVQPFGCEDDSIPRATGIEELPIADAAGGVVSLLGGNVVLTVPPGALTYEVRFSADLITVKDTPKSKENEMEDMKKSANGNVLRAFQITPSINFFKPVQISINYSGCLENMMNPICQGMTVSLSVWEDEFSFLNLPPACCSVCNLDTEAKSISSCMMRTGILAVTGEMNQ